MYISSRHIRDRVEKYVNPKHCRSIVSDFIEVVAIKIKHKMIKKNVSRYDYYIIRLASRKGAKLIKKPTDLTHSKTRNSFDDRLFGAHY